jgi:hypothetical protein
MTSDSVRREPISEQYFIDRGIAPAVAKQYATEHNELAGLKPRGPSASDPVYVPAPAPKQPLSPVHEARVAARAAELVKLTGTDTATARSVALQEFAYRSSSGADRAVMLNKLEQGRTEEAIVRSIDDGMKPAQASYEYVLPEGPRPRGSETPEQRTERESNQLRADNLLRTAMFEAGIPRELGNQLAQSFSDTAAELYGAGTDPKKIESIMARNESSLRRLWGPAFDSRLAMVHEFIRAQPSPAVRQLFTDHPELFSDPAACDVLARVAEHQRRTARK